MTKVLLLLWHIHEVLLCFFHSVWISTNVLIFINFQGYRKCWFLHEYVFTFALVFPYSCFIVRYSDVGLLSTCSLLNNSYVFSRIHLRQWYEADSQPELSILVPSQFCQKYLENLPDKSLFPFIFSVFISCLSGPSVPSMLLCSLFISNMSRYLENQLLTLRFSACKECSSSVFETLKLHSKTSCYSSYV